MSCLAAAMLPHDRLLSAEIIPRAARNGFFLAEENRSIRHASSTLKNPRFACVRRKRDYAESNLDRLPFALFSRRGSFFSSRLNVLSFLSSGSIGASAGRSRESLSHACCSLDVLRFLGGGLGGQLRAAALCRHHRGRRFRVVFSRPARAGQRQRAVQVFGLRRPRNLASRTGEKSRWHSMHGSNRLKGNGFGFKEWGPPRTSMNRARFKDGSLATE